MKVLISFRGAYPLYLTFGFLLFSAKPCLANGDLLGLPIKLLNQCGLAAARESKPVAPLTRDQIKTKVAEKTFPVLAHKSDLMTWIGNLYTLILSLPKETPFEERVQTFSIGVSAIRDLAKQRLKMNWCAYPAFWGDGSVIFYGSEDNVLIFFRDGRILKGLIPEIMVELGMPPEPLETYQLVELLPR